MKSTIVFAIAALCALNLNAQEVRRTNGNAAVMSRGGGSADQQRDTLRNGAVASRRAPGDTPDTSLRRPATALAAAARPSNVADDSYSQFLFAPELVMKNQAAVSLQEPQRARIMTEMSQAQLKFTETQWALSAEEEKLNQLLQQPTPGEPAVLAQMDRILSLEQSIKRTQMSLLVRIKNVLTPEQQSSLSRLRRLDGATKPAEAMIRRGGGD